MYPNEVAHISKTIIDLLILDVTLITISKLSSEIIDRDHISVMNERTVDFQELRDRVYDKYPALYLSNDYKIFWGYSKDYFIEINDTITYAAAVRCMTSGIFFILLNDFEDTWEDNLSFLLDLDRKEEEVRIERERDIYDVKIIRKGEEKIVSHESTETTTTKEPRKIRTESEILAYAMRNEPEPFCYITDRYLGKTLISDMQKGYPRFKIKLRLLPDVQFEKRASKDAKGKQAKPNKKKK
ncbi:uncharacterized protein [Onthophagus taurus]|uniref:uncharacterized protein n=1 Tax=Onthophagus taurus TaxID=166361 RepID=UPI000C208016|nr:uncharacterized protein LOC111416399 [Onthophagus taurus]